MSSRLITTFIIYDYKATITGAAETDNRSVITRNVIHLTWVKLQMWCYGDVMLT